jgi:hypothetical protein
VWETRLADVQPGGDEVTLSGETLSGMKAGRGIYIYRLTAGDQTAVRRMLLVK